MLTERLTDCNVTNAKHTVTHTGITSRKTNILLGMRGIIS